MPAYRNDERVVPVIPRKVRRIQLPLERVHLRNAESLVVLLVRGADDKFVICGVDSDVVRRLRVRQVAHAPLEAVHCVEP